MATKKEITQTYDYMDEIFRRIIGEHGDITGAMYNGDFSKSLEEAQNDKHKYMSEGINLKKGDRILDIGCGWGPFLDYIHKIEGQAYGLTLSPKQAEASKRKNYEVHVQDWKSIEKGSLGIFDGIVSVGAFEHFCSKEEYQNGKQDEIYEQFFKLCYDLLPKGGRLYLQTMLWGKYIPEIKDISVKAKKFSNNWIAGHLEKQYPGSWLPYSLEQLEKNASGYFKLVSENNGKLDYIETMRIWRERLGKTDAKKMFFISKRIIRLLFRKGFKYQLKCLYYSINKMAFEKDIMTHQRLIFEKV